MTIPARAHFCWIGTSLPWAYVFAILSAAERSGLPEVILHHTDPLDDTPGLRAIRRDPRVRLSRLDPDACLAQAGTDLGLGQSLVALYHRLGSPAVLSDVLRAAILYLQGGIYLDVDTITTASLLPLLVPRQFVGTEFIVWPHAVRSSRSPAVWARHLALDVMRKAMRRMPQGWRAFRKVEGFYSRGVNGAVMGAEQNSPLCADYLRSMVTLPSGREAQPYALGPDLLQEVVGRYQGNDLTIHDPAVFYPLPPEISEQWFRITRTVRLDDVLLPQTRVVHWYASVRTKSRVAQIDPRYVREHRQDQLYSALVCACIRPLPEPG